MPQFISPLDDTLIRFDAAAKLLASCDPNATQNAMLEMLVRAAWRGDFSPPAQADVNYLDPSRHNDPEGWLIVPIEAPPATLFKGQLRLKPRPFEYFEGGNETLLSVMYSMDLLPGDSSAWDGLLKEGGDKLYLHGKNDALAALVRLPLSTYTDAGRAYLSGLFIPRRMLQAWLDRRSSRFHGLFSEPVETTRHPSAKPTNYRQGRPAKVKRGRPALAAWTEITSWALDLNARFPGMPRKLLAGRLHERALENFDATDVPHETTILRRLARILGDGDLDMRSDF